MTLGSPRIRYLLAAAVATSAMIPLAMAAAPAAAPTPGAGAAGAPGAQAAPAAPDGQGAPAGGRRGGGGGRRGGAGGGGGGAGGGGRGGRGPAEPLVRPEIPMYDMSLPMEKRLDDLMSRLTLEEKIGQTMMAAPAIARLGIPSYHWWSEALHGVARAGNATVFPQAIAMAATWNPDLHLKMAQVIGVEGRAKYAAALAASGGTGTAQYAGIDMWSPNINIFRDPRWGRGQETYGEDPYLTSRMGIAFVNGLQGNDLNFFQMVATPKHFAVHSGPESLRHFFDAVVTDQELFSTYLPAFEALIREGHAYSIMSAYNAVDGVPASANHRLLTDILRTQWGFQGYVVSDVDSVGDVWQNHHYVETAAEASAAAIKAGNDLNSGTTYRALAEAVDKKLITEEEIGVTVRRLMLARFKLGMFDFPAGGAAAKNPYAAIPPSENDTPAHDAVALEEARQSMVLLKNANNTLPLHKDIKTIAVIGPTADSQAALIGNYNGTPSNPITILQGIKNALPGATVLSSTAYPLVTETVTLAEAVKPEFLYTDTSRREHGLNASYMRSILATDRPVITIVDKTLDLKQPDAAARGALPYADGLYATWSGVLVPPVTGDYQLGFKGRDGFRLTVDGKMILDEFTAGNERSAGASIHLEKGKSYSIMAEFAHLATAAGGGRGGRGGAGGGGGIGGAAGALAAGGVGGGPGVGPGGPGGPGGAAGAGGAGAAGGRGGAGGRGAGGRAGGGGGGGGRGGRGSNFGPNGFGGDPAVADAAAGAGGLPGGAGGPQTPDTSAANPELLQLRWTLPAADGSPGDYAGQPLYAEAINMAKQADAVVLVLGITAGLEGEEMQTRNAGFNGGDRTSIDLPAIQENLLRQVVAAAGNKPVALVLTNGSALAVNWANDHVPAIVEAWYPGQHGDAVADVLFGNYNPAGRLPVTFYTGVSDLPAFTDYATSNRTYRYYTGKPLYPFGHGLSYSSFEYSSLTAPSNVQAGADVNVSVTVKNTSSLAGDEVVECYLDRAVPAVDPGALPLGSIMTPEQAVIAATPRKQLVGFLRVPLKANESKTVQFTVTGQQLSVVGTDGKRVITPGKVTLHVGGSSVGGLTQELSVNGTAAPEYRFVAPKVAQP